MATLVHNGAGYAMQCALAEMTQALNRGWENRDSRSFLLLQEERASVEIKVPAEDIKAVMERDG